LEISVRNLLFSILTAVLLTAVTLAAAEGIYSLVNWDRPQRSISHQFLALTGLAGQADDNIAAYETAAIESVSVFHDADKKLDSKLAGFFERYRGPRVALSSIAEGERVTVPESQADHGAPVASDSMAFGAMVDEENPS
jgi:hypothetical protein